MPEPKRQKDRPSSVVVATRVAPDEKRLAEMATKAAGDVSLSAFARRAIRERAIRVAAEQGLAGNEIGPKPREAQDAGS